MGTIYSVVYDCRDLKLAGESTRVERFTNRFEAERFAKGKTAWGQPTEVTAEKVPLHLVKRWGLA